jgi:hypothetical protein
MKLKKWITDSAMSRDDVALELGVHRGTLDHICAGRGLSAKVARKIEVLTAGLVMLKDLVEEVE